MTQHEHVQEQFYGIRLWHGIPISEKYLEPICTLGQNMVFFINLIYSCLPVPLLSPPSSACSYQFLRNGFYTEVQTLFAISLPQRRSEFRALLTMFILNISFLHSSVFKRPWSFFPYILLCNVFLMVLTLVSIPECWCKLFLIMYITHPISVGYRLRSLDRPKYAVICYTNARHIEFWNTTLIRPTSYKQKTSEQYFVKNVNKPVAIGRGRV